VGLAYFGTADPTYHGIDYSLLPAATPGYDLPSLIRPWSAPELPGYVAVSATVLTGVYLDPHWRVFYQGIRDMKPVEVLGNSIFIYRLDRWPEGTDLGEAATTASETNLRLADELAKAQWFDHAAVHYRRYLEVTPNDPAVLTRLGMALVSNNEPTAAIPVLEAAIGRDANNGLAHLVIAAALFDARRDINTVVAHARRAVLLRPYDHGPFVMLSRALAARGHLEEAAGLVGRALAMSPGDADALELQRLINMAAARSVPGAAGR
jgi:tetratricopeptide (TPR) repeat protein